MLSDSELIQAFIKDSVQHREVLLCNAVLTAQKVCESNQLSAKAEGIVLKTKVVEGQPEFSVKAGSSHWELINQALVSHHFLLMGEIDRWGFYQYKHVKLPKGYQLNCAPAVMLWRAWWKYQQRIVRASIPLELLIRTRETWYPIKHLECGHGLIYIRTLGSEIQLHSDDLAVWLNKVEPEKAESKKAESKPIEVPQV
jgi:hypothetical protein